jgi:hypothetical protein
MMAQFLSELDVHLQSGCDTVWILDAPLIYQSDIVGRVEVPKDFQTDLASVPRIPFIFELFGNRAHRSAVVHDYLYRVDSVPLATKLQADRVFLEAMRATGKVFFIRWFMFIGVAGFAWLSFHRKTITDPAVKGHIDG